MRLQSRTAGLSELGANVARIAAQRFGRNAQEGPFLQARGAVNLAFATAAVILVLTGAMLHAALEQSRAAVLWVQHTHEILTQIGRVREKFAQFESIQRGYLLTGSPRLLEEREQAASSMLSAIAAVTKLTVDNPAQHARARAMDGLARQRIGIAVERGELRKQQGFSGEWTEARMEAASRASARMYEVSRQFEGEELRLLASRQAEQEDSQRQAIGTLLFALLVVLLLLAPAYAGVHYHARQRARTERRLSDIVAAVPVAVWQLKTLSGGTPKFEYVSPTASLRGVSAAAFLHRPAGLLDLVVPQDRRALLAAMVECHRSLGNLDVVSRVEVRSGEVRWIRSSARLRRGDDGSVLWNGYWLDITPQKLLEQQLTDANNALESFSYSVSHDLRAPLSTIAGFARALAERTGASLDERSAHFLNRVRAGAQQMEALIDGMLVLGQVSRAPLQRERVDISALANEIVSELRESEPDRSVVIEVDPGLETTGDVRLLRQVLANLLSNAWKFTRPRPVARISVRAHRTQAGSAGFVVSDNGVGFENAVGKDLFGAFQRLHSSAEFPGSGIGLATVKRIIQRHGGEVWAESAVGVGTAVYFTVATAA